MPGRILNAYNRVVILGQVKVLVSSDGIENIAISIICDVKWNARNREYIMMTQFVVQIDLLYADIISLPTYYRTTIQFRTNYYIY